MSRGFKLDEVEPHKNVGWNNFSGLSPKLRLYHKPDCIKTVTSRNPILQAGLTDIFLVDDSTYDISSSESGVSFLQKRPALQLHYQLTTVQLPPANATFISPCNGLFSNPFIDWDEDEIEFIFST